MGWEITSALGNRSALDDMERLDKLLEEGWEPYAATGSSSSYRIHLRRSYTVGYDGETRIYRNVN